MEAWGEGGVGLGIDGERAGMDMYGGVCSTTRVMLDYWTIGLPAPPNGFLASCSNSKAVCVSWSITDDPWSMTALS